MFPVSEVVFISCPYLYVILKISTWFTEWNKPLMFTNNRVLVSKTVLKELSNLTFEVCLTLCKFSWVPVFYQHFYGRFQG